MKRKYLSKFEIDCKFFNPNNWDEVHIDVLTLEEQNQFLRRKNAVDLFLQSDISTKNITLQSGVSRSEIYRLLARCLTLKDGNNIYGYAGLLNQLRLKPYETEDYERSNSGNFTKLLTDYPELSQFLLDEYFNKDKKIVREKKQSVKNIHRKFIEKCREIGIGDEHYPFNSTSMAFKSIERYLKQLLQENSMLGAKMNGKDAFMLAKGVNNSSNAYTQIIRPFERVEFDAHQIDAIFSIVTYTPQGDKIINIMSRVWLLCVIDVASRAVIGHHVCYNNNNYSADEVLKCFKKALLPWEPRKLDIPTLKYNKGDGFPSYIIEEAKFAIWDEICLDNAKSHQAAKVLKRLSDLNCSVNFGPVAAPTRRSIIERFFKTLEFNGFHRLPSTTGSNVLDPKRDNAEENAVIYEITVDQLEEVMDLVIANYNNTSHSAQYGFTPLEVIRNRVNRGMYIRKLPIDKRSASTLFPTKQPVKVNGNISKGRNPYINYKYERYTSVKLNNDSSMIGKTLILVIDEDNIQTVRAFESNGLFYDTLIARGIWGKVPHSLNIRLMIMKHKNKAEFDYVKHKDPIAAFQDFLAIKSLSDKKARIKLQEIERYKKQFNIDAQLERQKAENQRTQESQNFLQQKIIENRDILSKQKNQVNETNLEQLSNEKEIELELELAASVENERHYRIIESTKNKKGKSITF